MLPNLLVGDRLVADGWAYWKNEPVRGDIMVFDYPKDPSVKYVKRVIGLPGDTVEIRSGELYLNKVLVSQQRTSEPTMESKGWNQVEFLETQGEQAYPIYRTQPPMLMDFGPITVPANEYFVMGDNRDRSNDSRIWGMVPRELVIGRMAYVYFSWDSVEGALRRDRIGLKVK